MIDNNIINDCIKQGITSITDICKKIEDEIDLQQEEINLLAQEQVVKEKSQNNLRLLLKQLRPSIKKEKVIVQNVDFTELPLEIKEMAFKIIQLIENQDYGSKQIIDKFGITKQKEIFTALKWLWDKDILNRKEDLNFCKGDQWAKRPSQETKF